MSGQLASLEQTLLGKGFPAMSPWWHKTLKIFYDSRRRQLVLRVGRRGGKSSTLCRIAVLEALYGDHKVPAGDVGVVGIVSVSRSEATQRLRTIKAILDALGVGYHSTNESIELIHRPIMFKVYTASLAGVVGGTWVCAICDEVARWRDADSGANPAAEVLASLRPCLATMPNARLFLSSSPLGTLDSHAKAFEDGDNTYQICRQAPTWIANPSVTEEETHALERNERSWKREFAAEPQGTLTAVFDLAWIDGSIDLWEEVKVESQAQSVMCIDASRGGDAWTWLIANWIWHAGRPRLLVKEVGTVPDGRDTLGSIEWLVQKAKENHIERICGDQYEAGSISGLFSKAGLSFYLFTWTAPLKKRAVDRLERVMRDHDIALPDNDTLRRQLAEYSEKISRSGEMLYSGRGRHDDHAAVVLTLIMADMDNKLPLVSEPMQEVAKTVAIEQKWVANQTQRMLEKKAMEREMNGEFDFFESFADMP